ncbi:carboxylesterase [Elizabethkingia miricola]|uniref:Acetyl esterase n=1 Tax=Elizabethkingia miricola TaxID=172045 RepID=A0ABY3NFX3_ELIMR|nr:MULTISPECIES: alpha/beta hydrolase [Elizabethkingia]OBS12230.1 carboxylesterase [Elizabethkingia miricola]TYO90954.1 acetyl esterase [Elizabethkingia miricola]
MKLTTQVKAAADHMQNVQVFDAKDALDMSRKSYESMAAQFGAKKEMVRVIEEFNIDNGGHSIPVRVYRPENLGTENSSAIIYTHGGWFVAGSFETHDAIVRKLANATKSVVIFPEYRLAPEHPFPAGLDDCIYVTNWVYDNAATLKIDKNNIGIVGDSAGGALSVAIAGELGDRLRFQVLIYPAGDNKLSTGSWQTYANGPVLSLEGGVQAWEWYLQKEEDKQNPLAVPVLIEDFKHTPPTQVLLAGHDPLHDDGKILVENLKASGVETEVVIYEEMIHGFMHMDSAFTEVQDAVEKISTFINSHIA